MKRYWTLAATVLVLFLTTYLLVEALDVRLLTDPGPSLRGAGWMGAGFGVLLLVADQFLPVPSSLVMISLGALYGAPAGIVLALAGRVGMAATGFAVGRAGGPLLERVVSQRERARADTLLRRWGALAVLISRPVPLLAETVAIVAGASPLRWSRAMFAAGLGSMPEAVAYSLAGSISPSLKSAGLLWGSFLLIACGFWLLGRWIDRSAATAGNRVRKLDPDSTTTRHSFDFDAGERESQDDRRRIDPQPVGPTNRFAPSDSSSWDSHA